MISCSWYVVLLHRTYNCKRMNVHTIIFITPTSALYINTLKTYYNVKNSYMFRHQDVILRECVFTLLKSLSLLQIVFSYHFVRLLCVWYI